MKRVLIESPYKAATPSQRKDFDLYLKACVFDSLGKGEAPFASHGFYTQYLDDKKQMDRDAGMLCGKAWAGSADTIAFYVDYGMSPGMIEMLKWLFESLRSRLTMYPNPEIRSLPNWFDEEAASPQDKEGDLA